MLIGHAPAVPGRRQQGAGLQPAGVDKARARSTACPPMANLWGKHLGVIGLHLKYDGRLVVDKSRTTVEVRAIAQRGRQLRRRRSGHRAAGGGRTRGHHPLREDAGRQQRLPHERAISPTSATSAPSKW
jgi:hypothetical protein